MKLNWASQRNDYRGLLSFKQVTDSISTTVHPACSIPLFLREVPVPVRQPKITEHVTLGGGVAVASGGTVYDNSFAAAFYGVPDPLNVGIQGWVVTPVVNGIWAPTTTGAIGGPSMNLSNHSYADIISAYIEGRMQRDATGRGRRVDPFEFVDPYGNVYSNPKITSFDYQYTPTTKKVNINMNLWLEA